MNKIILLGRLTKDIELKDTTGGKSYVSVGLAVDRPFSKNKEVDFFNLVAWDKTAEMISRYLEKGRRILIEGRLQTNNFEMLKRVMQFLANGNFLIPYDDDKKT